MKKANIKQTNMNKTNKHEKSTNMNKQTYTNTEQKPR